MAAARGHFNLTSTTNTTTSVVNWRHSPVPYLFGGLAAMLGLIAFALLILACSYWRFSGYFQGGNSGERDLEAGQRKPGDDDDLAAKQAIFEEKVLVIMAGEKGPTFLATPMSSRSSSFGDTSSSRSFCTCENGSHSGKLEVVAEDLKPVMTAESPKNEGGSGTERS